MKYLRRAFGLVVVTFVLLTTLTPNAAIVSSAQDANTITVDGSKIVSSVIKLAAEQYLKKNPETKIETNESGTDAGFEKLCAGTLDIAMAARSITDEEIAACQSKNVKFIESVLGYDALVLGVNTTSTVTCLTPDQLNKLLSPGSTNVKNWNAVDPVLGDLPISAIYATGPDSQSYILADSVVAGDKLRSDLTTVERATNVAEKVTAEVSAIGLFTAAEYAASTQGNQGIRQLQLKGSSDCVSPQVANLEEARYPGTESLFLYVNAASLDRAPVADFMKYMISGDGRAAIIINNFLPASGTAYDRAQNYLNTRQTGRTFSRIQAVNIPATTTGTVTVAGSSSVFPVIKAVTDAFKPRYDQITVTTTTSGNEAGYRNLCGNSVDLIGATRLPTEEEASVCQKANILTYQLPIGSNAVVLVANEKNPAVCLSTEQIGKVFGKASEGTVKKWSDVDASFGAADLLILTPPDSSAVTDLLLSKSINAVAPIRRTDVTEDNDPLYRAAATQNVEGAITYMTYSEYKSSTSKVKLLQVNSGNGCMDASEDNIKKGAYPISESLYLVMNLNAFSRPEVKAFAWYLLGDDALAIMSKQGLIGTDLTAVAAARDAALARFTDTGTVNGAGPTGSATVAATASSVTATQAATENSAPAPTEAATPQATASADATAAPTAAATAS
jgi:phosphate transport system substrate-binding protein